MDANLGMIVYSALLALALIVSSPVWLWRMATSGRYREGLSQRLGFIPTALLQAIQGKRVVWLHAVSVGETLAAVRLVEELGAAIGEGWVVVISTTTATGQKVARERFGSARVFYYPLDFAWIVRRYLRALKPELLILMESELWPRMLVECERASIPVAVVNARISDRSFPRYMRLRWLWKPLFAKVTLFLAQGEETAQRLKAIGAGQVRMPGNLKYDVKGGSRTQGDTPMTASLRRAIDGRPVILAGSTTDRGPREKNEEDLVVRAMSTVWSELPQTVLILAPRQPGRFEEAYDVAFDGAVYASDLKNGTGKLDGEWDTIVLDTIGDLASLYDLANVAFIGGSLANKGGHNPLEAARFGVPVIMGNSYENFREIVHQLRAEGAIQIVSADNLGTTLLNTLRDGEEIGQRGKLFVEGQTGATERTVKALMELLK